MIDAAGATDLSPAQCLARLRSATWGRVAISMQAIAMVVPVPVLVVEDRVVFATTRGSVFDRAVQGQPISIQTEGQEPGLDDDGDLLWSIVVSGICVPDGGHLPLPPRPDREPAAAGTVLPARWNAVPFSLVQGWRAPLPRRSREGGPSARGSQTR